MFARAAQIHRQTRKPHDIAWNRFVMRPFAAALLVPIERTSLTPNQLTLGSLALFVISLVMLALLPGVPGLVVGVLLLQLSYALDCADGQLARLRGTSSAVGGHLDFTMDEVKALLLVAGVSARLWLQWDASLYLFEGAMGAAVVGSGLSLTTFMRRPEYAQLAPGTVSRGAGDYGAGFSSDEAPPPRRESKRSSAVVRIVEAAGKFVIHYPSHITLFAIAGRLDLFLHVFLAAHAAHAGRCLVAITRTLGGPAPAGAGGTEDDQTT